MQLEKNSTSSGFSSTFLTTSKGPEVQSQTFVVHGMKLPDLVGKRKLKQPDPAQKWKQICGDFKIRSHLRKGCKTWRPSVTRRRKSRVLSQTNLTTRSIFLSALQSYCSRFSVGLLSYDGTTNLIWMDRRKNLDGNSECNCWIRNDIWIDRWWVGKASNVFIRWEEEEDEDIAYSYICLSVCGKMT